MSAESPAVAPLTAFRADAAPGMGIGHLVRSLTLARAWQARGGKAVLFTGTESESLLERATQAGVEVAGVYGTPTPDGDPVVAWASSHPEAWVCLDGYHFGVELQQAVGGAGARLIVIEDYVRVPEYHADILLDQNPGAEREPYRVRPGCQLLLGPRYALVASEFRDARVEDRLQPSLARRVVITFGGDDPGGMTAKAVEGIMSLNSRQLEVTVVVGVANPNAEAIRRAVAGRPALRVVQDARNMPELMAWADLAVAGSGSTSWEFCMMGVPVVSVVLAENQRLIGETVARAGIAESLGWHEQVTPGRIAAAVASLIPDQARREAMAARGQALVDGQGPRRVVEAMMARRPWLRDAS